VVKFAAGFISIDHYVVPARHDAAKFAIDFICPRKDAFQSFRQKSFMLERIFVCLSVIDELTSNDFAIELPAPKFANPAMQLSIEGIIARRHDRSAGAEAISQILVCCRLYPRSLARLNLHLLRYPSWR
jgi:hypothetical protein